MSPTPYTWPHRRLRAMGCEMAIWLDVDTATAEAILPTAAQMFHEAEARLSRFRPTSELMQLNQRAGEWVAVSAELWGVVQEALHWAAVTEGLFDPTQLNALVGLGYDRSFEQLPMQSMTVPPAPRASQWAAVEMNPDGRAIRLPATIQLDLGGIAKGYTAQQVADFLRPWGPALVNAGGDVTATAAPQGWAGWPVGLAKPLGLVAAEDVPGTVWLVEATLATSGTDYRRWQHNGRTVHHIIDPRTGTAAETDLLTVAVLGRTASEAEAWATAALVAGRTAAQQHLRAQGLAAVLWDVKGERIVL